jgi:hypothetical protein
VADAATHHHRGSPTGFLGVAGEFPGHPDGLRRRHSGDWLLPGWGVLLAGVVVTGRPFAGQSLALHGVIGRHQVEYRAHQMLTDAAYRHAP